MHAYRTHTCNALNTAHVGQPVKLSGWVHRKRDHGNLLFVDLRDHYGMTQLVCEAGTAHFDGLNAARPESVVTISGEAIALPRSAITDDGVPV